MWTILYLCPNTFELNDKIQNLEQYNLLFENIGNRNACVSFDIMVWSTLYEIVARWEEVVEYFTSLLGHRDTLSNPDAHDSLLFDDDSFSRSRRYFWAINYLAQLDVSISGNIMEVERFFGTRSFFANHHRKQIHHYGAPVDPLGDEIRYKLGILQNQREHIRRQRIEAIELRDAVSGVLRSPALTLYLNIFSIITDP
jgi:hypothetical protein